MFPAPIEDGLIIMTDSFFFFFSPGVSNPILVASLHGKRKKWAQNNVHVHVHVKYTPHSVFMQAAVCDIAGVAMPSLNWPSLVHVSVASVGSAHGGG